MPYMVSVPTGVGTRMRFYETQAAAMAFVGEQVRKHKRMVTVTYKDLRPFFFGDLAPAALRY